MVFNMDLALKNAGGHRDLAEQLYGMFIQEIPDHLQCLKELYQKEEWEQFRNRVHKIHGATRYLGLPELHQTTLDLELYIKQQDSHQIASMYELTLAALARIHQEPTPFT